ncbi:MAG: Crp/Fnr family transcriptional regulator [Flavobacteriaceae bacterium]|nr:Crp/Fnr family transcriptional regulator [Flavobacteriaceae bacterium]
MNIGLEKYRYYTELMRNNDLFSEISHDALDQLLEIASAQYWPKKTCILDPTHTLYTFYIILSGKVKGYVFDDKHDRPLTLFLLTQNDVFDVFTLINGEVRDIRYETLCDTEVLSIPMYKLHEWIQQNQDVYKALLKYTTDKMRQMENYISNLIMEDTSIRLARLLYNHVNPSSRQVEVLSGLTHDELGALIGTTRTMIGRHIQAFKEEGILRTERREIEITNLALLQQKISLNT